MRPEISPAVARSTSLRGMSASYASWPSSKRAHLMVSTDGDPIDPAGQGVLFYLYSPDLAALREQLLEAGVKAGAIEDGTPGPKQQMMLTDPDGYVLMVAQIEPQDGES